MVCAGASKTTWIVAGILAAVLIVVIIIVVVVVVVTTQSDDDSTTTATIGPCQNDTYIGTKALPCLAVSAAALAAATSQTGFCSVTDVIVTCITTAINTETGAVCTEADKRNVVLNNAATISSYTGGTYDATLCL